MTEFGDWLYMRLNVVTFTVPGAPEAGRFQVIDYHETRDGTKWVWAVSMNIDTPARSPETFLRDAIEMDA